MLTRFIIAGVAVGAFAAVGASAHTMRHHHRGMSGGSAAYAAPAQPIPYAELDHYVKASSRERKSMAMAAANTGAAANTSASTSDTTTAAPVSEMPAPAAGVTPSASAMPDTSARPNAGVMTPPLPGSAPPENTPAPPVNGTAVNPPASNMSPATTPPK